jgi:hypothetical protein
LTVVQLRSLGLKKLLAAVTWKRLVKESEDVTRIVVVVVYTEKICVIVIYNIEL